MKDLVVLVADKNMDRAVRGLLSRYHELRIRPVESDIYVHPHRDPGCLLGAHDFLRPFWNRYAHALVMLDRDGCGQERLPREALEEQLELRLSQNGWNQRAAAVVLDPELEIWSETPT